MPRFGLILFNPSSISGFLSARGSQPAPGPSPSLSLIAHFQMSECISACQRDGDSCAGYVITVTGCHLGHPSRSETYLPTPQPENAAFYYEAYFEVLKCGGGAVS